MCICATAIDDRIVVQPVTYPFVRSITKRSVAKVLFAWKHNTKAVVASTVDRWLANPEARHKLIAAAARAGAASSPTDPT